MHRDPEYQEALRQSDRIFADGIGVKLAARWAAPKRPTDQALFNLPSNQIKPLTFECMNTSLSAEQCQDDRIKKNGEPDALDQR